MLQLYFESSASHRHCKFVEEVRTVILRLGVAPRHAQDSGILRSYWLLGQYRRTEDM